MIDEDLTEEAIKKLIADGLVQRELDAEGYEVIKLTPLGEQLAELRKNGREPD